MAIEECIYAKNKLFQKGIYCKNPDRKDKGDYGFCMSTSKNAETGKIYQNTGLMRHCQYHKLNS